MNELDRNLILRLASENFELRKLYKEHLKFEETLDSFSKKPYLTTVEELEVKQLKMKKYYGMQKMMKILDSFKENEAYAA